MKKLSYNEFCKQVKILARKNNVRLAGQKDDITSWRGYSYRPYTCIAIDFEYDDYGDIVSVLDVYESYETGNFRPQTRNIVRTKQAFDYPENRRNVKNTLEELAYGLFW